MVSLENYKVANHFDALKETIQGEKYSKHLQKPLAYWALPTDRRLPLALLGKSLGEILQMSFHEVANTPGIGEKKLSALVTLLVRASETPPEDIVPDAKEIDREDWKNRSPDREFDPDQVSEVDWARWRAIIEDHDLGAETLGRLCPSLRRLARVNWEMTLKEYCDKNISDIRNLKTHGEKRVSAILEVFHHLNSLLANMEPQPHLALRISPRIIDGIERWIAKVMQTQGAPSREEILQNLVNPLSEQVKIDANEQIYHLVRDRLGMDGPVTSVRDLARRLDLTRARIYQLLNEINDMLMVRWPTGRRQMHDLRSKLEGEVDDKDQIKQLHYAVELFFPTERRGADGPLDPLWVSEGEVPPDENMERVGEQGPMM